MDKFNKRYYEVQNNKNGRDFSSNAVNGDKRVYRLWNSNIKTLSTYYTYLTDVIENTKKDNHQKYEILRKLKLFDSEKDKEILLRQNIALELFKTEFENKDHILALFIFFLSLNSDYNIIGQSQYMLDTIDSETVKDYQLHLKKMFEDNKPLENQALLPFILYSDKELLDIYCSNKNDHIKIIKFLNDEYDKKSGMFYKRVKDCQIGSFKKESVFLGYYSILCELDVDKTEEFDVLITKILDFYQQRIKYFDSKGCPSSEDWDKFKKIFQPLSVEEQKSIMENLFLIGNEQEVSNDEQILLHENYVSEYKQRNSTGEDIVISSKARRGQTAFRAGLIKDKRYHGCRMEHCKINNKKFLIASHILEWNKSSPEEKVDINNGLLLCPSHDFLFDEHLITFDDSGKIIISKHIDLELYSEFNITKESRLRVFDENKEYLKKHREVFYEKERKK